MSTYAIANSIQTSKGKDCKMYDYEGLDDKSFNKDFRRAAELNGLTWYPWVGANYASAKKKILFVAESHYSSENDPKLIAKKLAEVADDIDLTKDVAWESHVNNWWDNVMVRGLHQALFKTSRLPEDGRKSLWKTTAFYNFIQRPMEYNANNKERPSGEEFFAGWNTFVAVVKILKPEVVVFIGTTAMGCFRQALSAMHIKHEEVSCEFANGAYSRSGWLEVDNYRTSLLSIRHTSNFFSWPTWNEVLTRRIPGVVKFLNDIVFSGYDGERVVDDGTLPDAEQLKGLPTWLNHRPILACDYQELNKTVVDRDYDDAKFISVGRAQYDNDDLSVKMFRWSGKRWSRQSEEVPIQRLPFMMAMMLNAIYRVQHKNQKRFKSDMDERLVMPEDLDFMGDCFDAYKELINRGLKEVKDLINRIDID